MKHIFTSLFLITIVNLVFAQNQLVKLWDKRFGTTDWEIITGFKATSEGGYIFGGYTESGVSGDKTQPSWGGTDFWVVKTDESGNKIWDKRFGGSSWDTFYDVDETDDGGFILGGVSSSGVSGDKTQAAWSNSTDFWIVRVDAMGIKLWDKRFGGSSEDYLSVVRQTSDGGFLLAGYSNSNVSGDKTQSAWSSSSDYWVVKTDEDGNKLWDKRFGGSSTDYLTCMQQTTDGGYVLGGWSGSGISGDKTQSSQGFDDYWIVKIDATGNKQWDKRFGGTQGEEMHSLDQTSDGGYIFGGSSGSAINGDKTQGSQGIWDYWIVRTDASGNKLWDKRYGGNGWDHMVHNTIETTDGGFLICGISDSGLSGDKSESNLGGKQGWMVKTDAAGTKVWDKTIKTNGYDRGAYGAQVNDTLYAFAIETDGGIGGYKTEPNWGFDDYWIVTFSDTTATLLLPVELTSFEAIAGDESIELTWSTASEQNSKEFEVQRAFPSPDNFQMISTLMAAGNSNMVHHYSYTDNEVEAGTLYYYRLKQTDHDGQFDFSKVIAQMIPDNGGTIEIYPNPFIEAMEVSYFVEDKGYVSIQIFNALGKLVHSIQDGIQTGGKYKLTIDASDLNNESGLYLLKMAINNKLYSQRIVLL